MPELVLPSEESTRESTELGRSAPPDRPQNILSAVHNLAEDLLGIAARLARATRQKTAPGVATTLSPRLSKSNSSAG